MNEEEEEAPLEDPHIHRNYLTRERHVARSEEQRATDASQRVAQLFKTFYIYNILGVCVSDRPPWG
jgi:hypothetical protein